MSIPWWTSMPPAEIEIPCRGERHRLAWAEGALTTPDHRGAGRRPPVRRGDPPRPADDPAELLDAEGCDAAARGWRVHRSDPRSLVLGRRHPGEALEASGAGDDPMARLLTLVGPALERRLQAEAAVGLGARVAVGGAPAGDRDLLEAATVGRCRAVLDRWLGPAGRAVRVELGDRSAVTAGDRPVLTLAPTWLGEVWGRYLSVVDGFLVLEVRRIVDDRAEVLGVSRPGAEPARLLLVGPAPWRARGRQDA